MIQTTSFKHALIATTLLFTGCGVVKANKLESLGSTSRILLFDKKTNEQLCYIIWHPMYGKSSVDNAKYVLLKRNQSSCKTSHGTTINLDDKNLSLKDKAIKSDTRKFSWNGKVYFKSSESRTDDDVYIGMSKDAYLAKFKINLINCDTYRDYNGKLTWDKSYPSLHPDFKSVCSQYIGGDKDGKYEKITLDDISYEVIQARFSASKFIERFGIYNTAIFYKDKLVSLEIIGPKVKRDVLIEKFGSPKINDSQSVSICTTVIGNSYRNRLGYHNTIWTHQGVRANYRIWTYLPEKKCTGKRSKHYFIIDDPKVISLIEDKINLFIKNRDERDFKNRVRDSRF
ncbi:MAG: hypothetical protein H8D23_35625 [Candidatus Brocadiales bacterium]|nr:hypothetical protein [Candidatus Brocadiales bacterium]